MTETSDRPVVEFDHHSRHYGEHSSEILSELRDACPVGWSETYGGFWVATRYDDVTRIAKAADQFSSRLDIPNDGRSYTGQQVPPVPSEVLIPINIDPPDTAAYRGLLYPYFGPKAAEELRPWVHEITNWCIDQHIESGEMDLVRDVLNPVPALVTLYLLGLDLRDWKAYADPCHAAVYTPKGTERYEQVKADMMVMRGLLEDAVRSRREMPVDDFIGQIVVAEVNGRRLTDEEILGILHLTVMGGVDTTTALIAFALHYLGGNPTARTMLRDDPSKLPMACEEFLRHSSPVQGVARTANEDVVVGSQTIRARDRVVISWASANHDPAAFEDPDEVKLDRWPNRHGAFGHGPHRCLGSNIARSEFQAVVEEVLKRMPDYTVAEDGVERYESIGSVNGYMALPVRFTPGPSLGTVVEGLNG